MAVTKISNSSLKNLNKYDSFLAGNPAYEPPVYAYESIATVSVGTNNPTFITFSSIPQTYTHLQLRFYLRGTVVATSYGVTIALNKTSYTGSDHTWHRYNGDGSATSSNGAISQVGMAISFPNSNSYHFPGISDILYYTDTSRNKTVRTLAAGDGNDGSSYLGIGTGTYYSTSAVSTIVIVSPDSSGFQQYTHAALYGVK
jgi:hypothetical protein